MKNRLKAIECLKKHKKRALLVHFFSKKGKDSKNIATFAENK